CDAARGSPHLGLWSPGCSSCVEPHAKARQGKLHRTRTARDPKQQGPKPDEQGERREREKASSSA
ncbi:unnamed protein product, partial [Amoebophrya sp. A25]